MRYQILNQDADLSLIERLLKVRNISDNSSKFLNPTLANYWIAPFLLNDMEKGVSRIIQALKNNEKIVIFGDYDVDGITASYTLYKFITKYLNYKNITIRYPNRIDDGYGLKTKHLDAMKEEGVSLVITVDNGITSLAEAEYAKELGMDLIITDHHQPVESLPDAIAVINPQVSPNYPFKGLAGVGVAFKVLNALLTKSTMTKDAKNEIFNYFLPIVAIGTVADVVPLVITVDNGITSLAEAEYAKELGMDLIITDHHQPVESLPDAIAVINPQVSPNYPFKGLAGVGVAFKVLNALLTKSTMTKDAKNEIFNYFLPIVAIGTVADVVPLVDENRVIVKRGLELMNHHPDTLPKGLAGFLKFLNIKGNIDTFHIGFVIGPRINAGGRLESPYDSLKVLLCENGEQEKYIQKIEDINTERRKMQDQAFRIAEKQLDPEKKFLSVCDEDFHEGIIGIVAGRITEKYNKPSAVFKIDKEKQQAVASLRGPEYFNVIEMIAKASPYLKRFGGHKGAGGLTIELQDLDKVIKIFEDHCEECICEENLEKVTMIDTVLFPHERNYEELSEIENLAPFGEGNNEPNFLFENIIVERVEKVGKNGGAHLKIFGKFGDEHLAIVFWGRGEESEKIKDKISLVGNVKRDTYNGGFYIHGVDWIE